MSPVGGLHGVTVARLVRMLLDWAEQHDAGAVMTETGFVLATNPDTVRAPHISFVRRKRIETSGLRVSFWMAVMCRRASALPSAICFRRTCRV